LFDVEDADYADYAAPRKQGEVPVDDIQIELSKVTEVADERPFTVAWTSDRDTDASRQGFAHFDPTDTDALTPQIAQDPGPELVVPDVTDDLGRHSQASERLRQVASLPGGGKQGSGRLRSFAPRRQFTDPAQDQIHVQVSDDADASKRCR
jgi:hypothetical protein